MNGIDTGAAALLANRVSGLNPVGSQGSAGAAQAGVSALATGTAALPDAQTGTAPQASAQTVLSAIALALDAIIRSGGEATPAVVGEAPVWADPDAAAAATPSLPLPGVPAAAEAAALEAALLADAAALAQTDGGASLAQAAATADSAGAAANGQSASSAASGAAAAQAAAGPTAATAQTGPIAALAASLQQTVTGSGLFYESHLAQWLVGQRSLASLANEPQNRLVDASAQLPLAWAQRSDDADDVFWSETLLPGGRDAAGNGAAQSALRGADGGPAGFAHAAGSTTGAAFVRANGALAEAALLPAAQDSSAAAGAPVHAAVIPLVRQQLDLLATGEFRWIGEAWPGVRLDWSIEQERVETRDGRDGRGGDPADAPWRTRLTLALPSLGTVDAELTLSGASLGVRVQANPGGAARLVAGSDALRNRLEALGLALTGLAIREIGGAAGPGEAAKAAHAYARAAAAQDARTHAPGAAGSGDLDWDL